MRARARRSIILTGGAVAAATGVVSGPAHATTDSFVVTNTLDDGSPGSLRSAIDLANADPDLTTITFASGVTGTITLTTGALVVYSALDIVGPGAGVLRVDGGGRACSCSTATPTTGPARSLTSRSAAPRRSASRSVQRATRASTNRFKGHAHQFHGEWQHDVRGRRGRAAVRLR